MGSVLNTITDCSNSYHSVILDEPLVVNRHSKRITSVCSLLRLHLWPYSDVSSCLIARRSVAFLPPWIKRVWKRCAACSCRTRSLAWDQGRTWGVYGIGRETDGSSSISMAPDRPHDNALCLRVRICHHLSGVCLRCVPPAIWGASVGRLFVPVQRSCRPIRISGSSPLEERAMETTEASCYGDSA